MSMNEIRIGSNVDGWCTRCKLVLAHTVEAAVGETIKRVHCNTCHSKHTYRQYEPGTAPKVRTTGASLGAKREAKPGSVRAARKKVGFPGVVRASDYDTLMKGRDLLMAARYSFRDRYGAGDVLTHIEFGIGVVTADKGSNKIEVLFQTGPKTLVHGRPA